MVKTAVQVNLSELEQLLHQRLYAEPLRVLPLQVRCLLQKNSILIFIEHPEPQLNHPRRVFRIVRQMLEDEKFLHGDYQILLYLKTHGADKPYSFHNLNGVPHSLLDPNLSNKQKGDGGVPQENFPTLDDDEQLWDSIFAQIEEERQEQDVVAELDGVDLTTEAFPVPPDPFEDDGATPEASSIEEVGYEEVGYDLEPSASVPRFDLDRDGTEEEEPTLTDFTPIPKPPNHQINKNILLGLLFTASVFCGTFYVLTRPCVLGQCELIGQAQNLADTASQVGQVAISGQTILQSQQDLNQAIAALETIPWWSSKYGPAQQLLTTYRKRAEDLGQMVEALQAGAKAGQMSNSTLLTSQRWDEVRQQWQAAIVLLENISPQSDYYNFAQQKIPEYTQNLKSINGRLEAERDAVTSINEAKTAAKIAEVRQGVAQSLEDWELAESTWQTAIARLESISPQSTTYGEAQSLLDRYRAQLVAAKDERTEESFAARAYDKALELKLEAKAAESKAQWSSAVLKWRTALTSLEQIPKDSFYFKQVQMLKPEYQNALTSAQGRLNVAVKNQQVLRALDQTCGQRSQICKGEIKEQTIKVTFTPEYLADIANTAKAAQTQTTPNSQVRLIEHISTLEEAFQAIARTSKLPVSVYHPDGQLIYTYQP